MTKLNSKGGTITGLIQKGFQIRKHFLFFFFLISLLFHPFIHILSIPGHLKSYLDITSEHT